jgi:glycosyltransferase involved in cell wall biosynthesis
LDLPLALIPFLLVHAWLVVTLAGNVVHMARQRRRAATPRVSVVVPARNEERHLPHLLDSVLAQQYADFEMIVYDDGSTDRTPGILAECRDPRLVRLRGEGPPPGWLGKPHALHAATAHATGDVLLFLDADCALAHPDALRELVERHAALPAPAVLTGLTNLRPSGAWLLVSMAAHAILTGLPWFMPRRLHARSLGAVNGQAWMIGAGVYRRLDPHAAVRGDVLEDVKAGRHLRAHGVRAYLAPLAGLVHVRMYEDYAEAWRGFRKNAYLMLGGTPVSFAAMMLVYVGTYLVAPLMQPWLLVPLVVTKAITDRACGLPFWFGLTAPVSHVLAVALGVDSAHAHATGRVRWKERKV